MWWPFTRSNSWVNEAIDTELLEKAVSWYKETKQPPIRLITLDGSNYSIEQPNITKGMLNSLEWVAWEPSYFNPEYRELIGRHRYNEYRYTYKQCLIEPMSKIAAQQAVNLHIISSYQYHEKIKTKETTYKLAVKNAIYL